MDFNKILNQWLAKYPKGQIPIEASARIQALTDLFQAFKNAGFPMEYFTNTIKGKITTSCINPNHSNKRKRKIWIEYVAKHMEIAFYSIYDGSTVMGDNDLSSSPVSIEDVTNIPEEIEKIEEKRVKKPKETKTPRIEHYADETLDNCPVNSEFDSEMAALLGLKIK